MRKSQVVKVLLPPLVGVIFLSVLILPLAVVMYPKDVPLKLSLEDFKVSLAFSIGFGYPIALIVHLCGMLLVEALKELNIYRLSIVIIIGFVIAVVAVLAFADKPLPYYYFIPFGLSGISACLCHYYLDKKYPNPTPMEELK